MPTTLALTPTEHVTVLDEATDALVVEVVYGPGGSPPPPHRHPAQDERFTVLEGEVTARLAGEQRVAGAGEVLEVPRGLAHQFWNAGAVPARLRWETRPAGRTLEWFRALDAATRAAGGGRPSPRVLAGLLAEYDDVFRLAVPGEPVVRALLRVVATVAGHRGRAPAATA
jgi:mannose-6-phosphate isomerase-like protein (cupin superfamily)